MTKPRVPYELVPTNLAGVFATPLSEPVDHLATARSRLISQGILLKRPDAAAAPELRAAWERAFAAPWPAEKRIVPHSIVEPGVTQLLRDQDAVTTLNWAGAVITGTWTSAVGVWQVPTVSKPDIAATVHNHWAGVSWVGLDGGFISNDVLQAGVVQIVDQDGVPTTAAWYEWFTPQVADSPDYIFRTQIDNFEIAPGDTVFVVVQYAGTLPPAASKTVTGYETAFNDQLHVDYLSADGRVHELVFRGAWQHDDLMQLCPTAPVADPSSPLQGYSTEFNQQQHVIYLDGKGHVHELVYKAGWQHNDLMAISSGNPPPAGPSSALHAYVTTSNEQQHINYIDHLGHVHELYYDGSSWRHNDLFSQSVELAAPAARGSQLSGYQSAAGEQQHVNYVSADGHVHELVYRGEWHHDDLFSLCPEVPSSAVVRGPLTGYETVFGAQHQQHVNYFDANGHVHELVYKDRWDHTELTVQSGAELSRIDSPMVGYTTAWNSQQHVAYVGEDGNVREIFSTDGGQWTPVDISASAIWLDSAGPASPMAGWTSHNSKQHLNYVDELGHVNEFYYADDGHWIHNDLFKHATMTGIVYLGNDRTREHTTITLLPPPGASFTGDSAEWIMEPPTHDGVVGTLPRFTELTFTAAVCCGPNGTSSEASQGQSREVVENGNAVTETTLGAASVTIDYIGP